MDLGHLIHREGEERLRAAEARCDRARASHTALADLYRDRIDARRHALPAGTGSPSHPSRL